LKNYIVKVVCACLFGGLAVEAQGQEKENVSEFIALIQPAFLLNNAVHLDLEGKFKSKYLHFIVSPEIYRGSVSDRHGEASGQTDDLRGYGIGLSQKINLREKGTKPYISYGLMYRNLGITYQDEGFIIAPRDGLDFYEFVPYTDKLNINSFLWNSTVGVQITNVEKVIVDLYIGGGLKVSSKKSGQSGKRDYDQEYQDFAYNGSVFLAGIKLGYKIK
jgi:hypothetical protein